MKRQNGFLGLRPALALSVFALAAALAACGGSDRGGETRDVVQPPYDPDVRAEIDVSGPNVDVKIPEDQPPLPEGKLVFEDPLDEITNGSCVNYNRCGVLFSSVEVRRLRVRYTENDLPKAGVALRYTIGDDDYRQGALEPGNGVALTDDNGVAFVSLRIVSLAGSTELTPGQWDQFEVRVEVSSRLDVAPLFFDVVVDPKGQPPLTVTFDYAGTQAVGAVLVKLFQQPADRNNPGRYTTRGITCADLVPYVRTGEPMRVTATIVSGEVQINQSAVFPTDYFADLQRDVNQKYTIIVVGQTDGVDRVVGCDDQNGLVTYGLSKTVLVSLRDLPPRLKGTYEVRSQFDLLTALPDNVEQVVRHIVGFFQSPAREVLTLLCLIDVPVMNDLCSYVFTADDNLSTIGSIAVTIIDGLIRSLTRDSVWGNILDTGADVGLILTQLTFLSTVDVNDEPDEFGVIPASATRESWHTVRYRWTLGIPNCAANPDCGWNQFSLHSVGGDAVLGSFSASVNTEAVDRLPPYSLLQIDYHPVNIRYGALVNYIFLNIVLPRLAGDGTDGFPRIDTWDKLMKSLLGGKQCLLDEVRGGPTCCHTFASNLVSQAGGVTVDLVRTACDALTDAGAEYIENLLTGLDFATGSPDDANAFLVGTPDGGPCRITDVDGDRTIDAFGRADAPCVWDAVIRLNLFGGVEIHVDATFVGSRQ